MKSEEEYLEATRIKVKIAQHGRGSLTSREERFYSYSRYGSGGGCASSLGAFPAHVPDPEAYKTAKMIEGVIGTPIDQAISLD